MLEITFLRENADKAIAGLKKRGISAEQSVHDILKLDEQRRSNQNELDHSLAESNRISKKPMLARFEPQN
jgi:seryl-tRNA synthetase